MAGSRVRYVNKDSSAGGDGTTNATSGANRAYASFSEMEAAEQANLVTADVVFTCYFEGGASPTEIGEQTLLGWTVDSTRYVILQNHTDDYHLGKKNTGTYHFAQTSDQSGTLGACLRIYEPYTRIIGLQFKTYTGRANYAAGLQLNGDPALVGEVFIERCVFWQGEATPAYYRNGIEIVTDDVKLRVQNCFFHDFDHLVSGEIAGAGIHCNAGITIADQSYVQHNTFNNCGYAVYGRHTSSNFSNVRFRNNLMSSTTQADVRLKLTGWHAGSDYNVSTRADGSGETDVPGSNSLFSKTLTFTNATNGDCHTTDTDVLISNNLYSDANYTCTEDIDGNARTSSGDVGAGMDHVTIAAAASSVSNTLMMGI